LLAAYLTLIQWVSFVIARGDFYGAPGTGFRPRPVDLLYTLWNFSHGFAKELSPAVVIILVIYLLVLIAGITRREDKIHFLSSWLLGPIAIT
jgi:hypothetical protein